jgi:hypothetical protein
VLELERPSGQQGLHLFQVGRNIFRATRFPTGLRSMA